MTAPSKGVIWATPPLPPLFEGRFMPLADIQDRIAAACAKAGRPLQDVTLIAVSKVQPNARVAAVLDQGCR